jgi:DNA-binding phage protein
MESPPFEDWISDLRDMSAKANIFTRIDRMYKMFSERGNPTVSSLLIVLNALGIEISFAYQDKKKRDA